MFPIEPTTFQAPFATIHTRKTVSRIAVDAKEPPVPDVVDDVPKKIWFPAFCATFQPVALFIPVTATKSPTADTAGKVTVTSPALLAM